MRIGIKSKAELCGQTLAPDQIHLIRALLAAAIVKYSKQIASNGPNLGRPYLTGRTVYFGVLQALDGEFYVPRGPMPPGKTYEDGLRLKIGNRYIRAEETFEVVRLIKNATFWSSPGHVELDVTEFQPGHFVKVAESIIKIIGDNMPSFRDAEEGEPIPE
jgi:hypothetical protein